MQKNSDGADRRGSQRSCQRTTTGTEGVTTIANRFTIGTTIASWFTGTPILMVVLCADVSFGQVDIVEGGAAIDFGNVHYGERESRCTWIENNGRYQTGTDLDTLYERCVELELKSSQFQHQSSSAAGFVIKIYTAEGPTYPGHVSLDLTRRSFAPLYPTRNQSEHMPLLQTYLVKMGDIK